MRLKVEAVFKEVFSFYMKKVAIILINYRDYARKYLSDCIESLRQQDYVGERKIYIVDNATSPETAAYLRRLAPEAELVLNKNNDGFAKGNNDAMKLALAAGYDYIILFNMDTVIAPDCVREMVKAAEYKPDSKFNKFKVLNLKPIGAVQARLMLWSEKDKINTLGNVTHFLGFGYGLGYRDSIENWKLKIKDLSDICYPSGAAVLFSRQILEKVGLFDEEFWMYNEDQDLGWRIWLAGYRCVLAPTAVVYHKYQFGRSAKQFYWLDRNRIIAILKNYHLLTLFFVVPAFVIMEAGLFLFSWKSGWLREKLKVWVYFSRPRTWLYLARARRAAQSLRRTSDKEIVKMFSGRIWYQEVDDWKLRLINPIFMFYWWMVRKIIFW